MTTLPHDDPAATRCPGCGEPRAVEDFRPRYVKRTLASGVQVTYFYRINICRACERTTRQATYASERDARKRRRLARVCEKRLKTSRNAPEIYKA